MMKQCSEAETKTLLTSSPPPHLPSVEWHTFYCFFFLCRELDVFRDSFFACGNVISEIAFRWQINRRRRAKWNRLQLKSCNWLAEGSKKWFREDCLPALLALSLFSCVALIVVLISCLPSMFSLLPVRFCDKLLLACSAMINKYREQRKSFRKDASAIAWNFQASYSKTLFHGNS